MNSNQKYLNPKKTIGYLTVSKKTPIYKKTPTKKIIQTRLSNTISKNISNVINNSNISSGYNFLAKYISKKKFQGVLDMTSPGNKDALIDSDSELPPVNNTDNNKNKNIFKKNKCAKLVIDKVESLLPEKNEDYYKIIHPPKILVKTKTNAIFKKNNINRNDLLRSAYVKKSFTDNKNKDDIDNYHLLSQTQVEKIGYVQPFSNYQGYIKDSVQRKKQNCSMKNIHNNNNNGYNYNRSNKFYNTGFTYNNHPGNNMFKNKENTLITKSPADNVGSIEDSSINTNDRDNYLNNHKIYDNDRGLNSFGQEPIYYDKKNNTRFYYIHKNKSNNFLKDRNISEDSKKNTLYENYRDLIKLNTFSKLNNKKSTSKFILYPGFKEKLVKIQSVWRGSYVRELMSFYWNLTDFKEILNRVLNNHVHDYLLDFINALRNYKNMKKKNIFVDNKDIVKNDYNEEKNIDDYLRALSQKEEDYNNLLKKYNSLVVRCTDLQQIVNQINNKEKNKKENNIKNKNVLRKKVDLDSNNNSNENNIKDIQTNYRNNTLNLNYVNNTYIAKKFDIIEPEQNDNFDIIQTIDRINVIDDNGPNTINNIANIKVNLRGKKPMKKNNSIEKQTAIQYKYKNPDNELGKKEQKILSKINIKTSKEFNEVNAIKKIESIHLINIKPIKEHYIVEKQEEFKFDDIKINKEKVINNSIEKNEQFQYNNNINNNTLGKYYEHFSSNLNSINVEKFFILHEVNKTNKNIFEICHNELEIDNSEDLKISSNQKEIKPLLLEISNIKQINIINAKKEQTLICEIYKNESINILQTKKPILIEVFKNDSISLINDSKKQISLFDNNLLFKDNIIELSLVNLMNKNNMHELVSEKQLHLNIEIKALQKEKLFKECVIVKINNEININGKNKENNFKEKLMSISKDIKINIINENKKKIILYKDNIIELLIKNTNLSNSKNNIIYANERFALCTEKIISNFIEEKKDDIKLENSQSEKYDIEFIISNNNNLFINKIKKNTSDKITEITEELNRIEPNNHYELIFEGIINLKEDFKNETQNIENNNKIEMKKEEILYIQNNNSNNNENKNYNFNNEIFKGDCIEINPYELKRTKNNINNIFISYENKIEVLDNKDSIFTEKAKKNMMRIILPIRLKTTLREFVRRNVLPLLINKLKKIAIESHLNKFNKI